MTGSAGQQRVDAGFFSRFMVARLELPEQRRIAEILDTLDETIRKTEQLIAKLKQLKQGLLHDLLSRGIDDNGELRDPEWHPEQFKNSALGVIPRVWEVRRCLEICREIVVGIVIKPAQYYRDQGIPVLRSANVRDDGVVLEDLKFMSNADHQMLAKSAVGPGDLITVRTGYPGTTAVIPASLATANCVDIIVSRPGPLVEPDYLAMWVNSDVGKGQVLSRQGGLAQQHFNVGEMKSLLVALPNQAEQARVLAVYRAAATRIKTEEESLAKLSLLKNGLMDDLLTGRVRVTALTDEAAA